MRQKTRWIVTLVLLGGCACAEGRGATPPRAGRAASAPAAEPANSVRAARVSLLSSVKVTGATLTLADLLPSDAPAALRDNAQAIVLGATPQPGIERVLSRPELQAMLARSPLTPPGLVVPASIVVRRDVPLVSRRALLALIQSSLRNRPGFDAAALTPDEIVLPLPVYARSDETMAIDAIEQDSGTPGLRFRVRFVREPLRPAFYVQAPVKVRQQVLVAARSLRAGEILQSGDLRSSDAQGRQDARSLAGFKLLLNVPAGDPVSRSMLVPAPLVLAGHSVTMMYRGSGYVLTSTVIALQSAAMNQLVTVRNPRTGRTGQARVAGPGQVTPVKGAFHEMQIFQH